MIYLIRLSAHSSMLHILLTVSFYRKHSRIYNSYILEYIWIDGSGNLRSKYRTARPRFEPLDSGNDYIAVESSNYYDSAYGDEFALVPVAHYANPFFDPGRAFLILCETRCSDGTPTETNFRFNATKVFDNGGLQIDPWFRIEQSVVQSSGTCTESGTRTITLRKLSEKHYEYCLQAGLKIGGVNADVAPSQWNFKIGPCPGLGAGDELWVARYILHKLGQEFGVSISFKSKLASALNTTFSTEETRNKNGLKRIYKYIDRLWKNHAHDSVFALGAATASIRIPKSVINAGCGHLEDRRPVSDVDPHRAIAAIFSGACFD
jgi:glutamine synthetase